MKELVLLVANIGEGKSTLAKQYQEKGYVVISKDGLRYVIGAGNYVYKQEYEPIIWETELSMLESFMDIGANIVIDSICVGKSMRARYISFAKIYNNTISGNGIHGIHVLDSKFIKIYNRRYDSFCVPMLSLDVGLSKIIKLF